MTKKICEICGKKALARYKRKGKILCVRHYGQMYQFGKILNRTKFDKNEIISKDNYCKMTLYNNQNKEIAKTIFSKNQLEKIGKYKWYLDNHGYACSTSADGKTLWLHHLILGKKDNYITDHKDRNPLNNLNENLRFATRSQNAMNQKNVKGITWDKSKDR